MMTLKFPWLRRVLDILWISLLIFYVLIGVPQVPFHGDESTLIYTTHDYAYQFIDRDLSMVTYNGNPAIDPMLQDLRLLDGRVHKYLSGLFWHLAGYTTADLNQPWLWGTDWNYNLTNGHIPSDGLLLVTRLASAVLMAVGVVAMFGIGMHLDGRITAYAASAFYALNPALLVNGRRSMMEGALMGFSLLTVLAGLYLIRAYREHNPQRGWFTRLLPTLLLGLAAGMTLSSKHTGLLVVGMIFGALGSYLLFDFFRQPSALKTHALKTIGGLIFAGIIAVIIFYAMNPAWWGDPIGRVRLVASMRTDLLNNQMNIFGQYPDFPTRLVGFWRQMMVGTPMYYESPDWANFIGGQITTYEASPWRGLAPGESLFGVIFLSGLIAGGLAQLLLRDSQRLAERWIVGVWAIGMIVIVFIVTPLEWQRYYLPAIMPLCLLAGIGVGYFWDQVKVRRQINPKHDMLVTGETVIK
ncbi:MAG TPA: phospholipid carrier-dependent glycosyltransferase [Phototrophicaceae bacterium]|jgi:4-amino-4-deoxy-L-arabinose transferase-like glycosyltransferase|nr:phospholipid carrier-dependent glycosyltransferase [Phototrophicaceae bacterium]